MLYCVGFAEAWRSNGLSMGFLLETGFEDTCVIERAQKYSSG
jgi:hypothetical protein